MLCETYCLNALVKQDKMLVAYKCFERHTLQKVARKEIDKNVFFRCFSVSSCQ